MRKNKPKNTIFKDGVASNAISEIVENIPNIMFVCGLLLRFCIGVFLVMHALNLFSFIKIEKIRVAIAFVSVVSLEAVFTTFSVASARMRKQAFEIALTDPKKGDILNGWANAFFIFTLAGSLAFNGFVLYYMSQAGTTHYFEAIPKDRFYEVFFYIQSLNVFALLISEGSAFILNANIEKNP